MWGRSESGSFPGKKLKENWILWNTVNMFLFSYTLNKFQNCDDGSRLI